MKKSFHADKFNVKPCSGCFDYIITAVSKLSYFLAVRQINRLWLWQIVILKVNPLYTKLSNI